MPSTTRLRTILLDAFSIVPGAAFYDPSDEAAAAGDTTVWIAASKVWRDADDEVVHVVARPVYDERNPDRRSRSFTFGYCDQVDLVGVCIHPNDRDDDNFGRVSSVALGLTPAAPLQTIAEMRAELAGDLPRGPVVLADHELAKEHTRRRELARAEATPEAMAALDAYATRG